MSVRQLSNILNKELINKWKIESNIQYRWPQLFHLIKPIECASTVYSLTLKKMLFIHSLFLAKFLSTSFNSHYFLCDEGVGVWFMFRDKTLIYFLRYFILFDNTNAQAKF